jgi:hypothetical protein
MANPVMNQFALSTVAGVVALSNPAGTVSAIIDVSESGTLVAGQPVKVVSTSNGDLKVTALAAITDQVFAYINYNQQNASFVAGDKCEVSILGNVMWLTADGAINAGVQVEVSLAGATTVRTKTGASNASLVGFSLDKVATGALLRVYLTCPSFAFSS